jgi:hypothetical protein
MAFTETEKVDVRRFCGYSFFGAQNTKAFGYRYFEFYGRLEYQMNNLQPEEETVVRSMLVELRQLDTEIYEVRDNLDTDVAAVWKHNRHELNERIQLYTHKRIELCNNFRVPFRGSATGTLRLVV